MRLTHVGWAIQQVVEPMSDDSVSIDHVSHPAWEQTHGAGHSDASAQGVAGITEERKRQAVAVGESTVTDGVIATDPPDQSAQLKKLGVTVPEAAGLQGASRGVVLRIEEQYETATSQ